MTAQDRRITKTRKAIYNAFLQLLNQKDYEAITVQEIIDLADVGRSTFYSHYESKELLLDELCQKLFQRTQRDDENACGRVHPVVTPYSRNGCKRLSAPHQQGQ
ncbi:MAG: TetR/AcrR family transcriptional regulator, partial [Streptococcus salivarius]|nr:TetR/AcrR family transcriptional regulator [Streptococcus salivarius]